MKQDPQFWKHRPLSELMIRGAADDVRFLPLLYHKIVGNLNQRSLWHLSVRAALYCRCFCSDQTNYADWQPLPPVPEDLIADQNALEQDTLSVVDVPDSKMGLIIGRKGANILSIKESCSAEIFFGGDRGPRGKVFIIGPENQVTRAAAMISSKMQRTFQYY